MNRVLFVDDEPNVLQGLQRMLRPLRQEWEMAFAGSGPEALRLLATTPCDVVMTDMRMPGMNGAQLLAEVREQCPRAVRVILSGQSDREYIVQSVGTAHQYLSKPCDTVTLKETVARACALRSFLRDEALQSHVTRMAALPTPPAWAQELRQALHTEPAAAPQVAALIARDMALSARVLQLVNSAFFGTPRALADPAEAALLLGWETLRALSLSPGFLEEMPADALRAPGLEGLWERSARVARLARRIAEAEGWEPARVQQAQTGAFLRDVGCLVLAGYAPDRYGPLLARAGYDHNTLAEAERAAFGSDHAQVAAYLLGLWGLPAPVVEAVAGHHWLPQDSDFGVSAVVWLAGALTDAPEDSIPGFTDALARWGLCDRLGAWRARAACAGEEGSCG